MTTTDQRPGNEPQQAEDHIDRLVLRPGRGRMNRRQFLATGVSTGAAIGMESLASAAHAQQATPPSHESMPGMGEATPAAGGGASPANVGFVHFSPPDAAVIAAAAARLIPTDENGPGATEAGVVHFIDRQLAHETRGYTGPVYNQGPFLAGTKTQGDQSALPNADRFRLGIGGMDAYANQLYNQKFASLTPDQQDRILRDMEQGIPDTFDGASIQNYPPVYTGTSTEAIQAAGQAGVGAAAFFSLLLQYVMAGFFADPVHGGNQDMVGWKLIGFPGAQHGLYREWILRFGEEFTGEPKSLAVYQSELSGGE